VGGAVTAGVPLRLAGAGAAGYLLGSVPLADLATRLATGSKTDLRLIGSGNPGAANAMSVVGKCWGIGILVGDIGKGALASVVGRGLAGGNGAHVGGTAAVIGHCLPVWSRFNGGKGAATSCGQCLATFPAYFPIDLAVAVAVAKWRRRALPATATASAVWVGAGLLWWRRGWPNGWGPRPTAALPIAAAVSSAVIFSRFWAARGWQERTGR
ncbi:MAG: glycerol-3-phosphate acyltransferase, partial [Acidimicrobiales bacterium]